MNSNDTLADLAKKFNGNLDTIISYNALKDAEDFNAGDLIIIPGGSVPAPPVPKKTSSARSGKINAGGVVVPKAYDSGTGHSFPWGYCTYYVATKVHVPWGGNAKLWLQNAKSFGSLITHTPAIGTIVVTNDSR